MAKSAPLTDTVQRTLTRGELADELGLSVKAIDNHHRRSPPPPHSRIGNACRYNLDEYAAWMQANNLSGERGRPVEGSSPTIEAARLRQINAMAAKYEIQVERERGVLVNKEEYRRHWRSELDIVISKFRGMGATLAAQLVGLDASEIHARIDENVQLIFRELSE